MTVNIIYRVLCRDADDYETVTLTIGGPSSLRVELTGYKGTMVPANTCIESMIRAYFAGDIVEDIQVSHGY